MPSSEQRFDLSVIFSGKSDNGAVDEAHHSEHSITIVEKDNLGDDLPN